MSCSLQYRRHAAGSPVSSGHFRRSPAVCPWYWTRTRDWAWWPRRPAADCVGPPLSLSGLCVEGGHWLKEEKRSMHTFDFKTVSLSIKFTCFVWAASLQSKRHFICIYQWPCKRSPDYWPGINNNEKSCHSNQGSYLTKNIITPLGVADSESRRRRFFTFFLLKVYGS